jgi:hypothetical protein
MVGDSDATRASIKRCCNRRPSRLPAPLRSGKLGSLPLAFLLKHGYAGAIYPVHPKLDEISGIRCYRRWPRSRRHRSAGDRGARARIGDLLNECRPGQVKSALILSSGFAETGPKERTAARSGQGVREGNPLHRSQFGRHRQPARQGHPSISQVFDQAGLARAHRFRQPERAVGTAITALAHAEEVGSATF